MPIHGLTNAPRSFMKMGQIRKGARDAKGIPYDLEYFRVTFLPWTTLNGRDGAALLEQRFREVYGDKPTEINARLAYPTISEVWDANLECYKKGGLWASAYTDESGAHWIFRRDNANAEVIIRNRMAVTEDGSRLLSEPLDLTQPVYTYRNKKNQEVPVYLGPVGHLRVVIPELADIAVGFFEFRPESTIDIRNISSELASFDMFAQQAGKTITGIPFILRRREEEIPKRIDGNLVREKSWVVHLDLGGDWGARALKVIEQNALPEVIEGKVTDVVDNGIDWQGSPEEGEEPTTQNPDPIDDASWDAWLALCYRAEKVDVFYANVDRAKTTKSDLRAGYGELLGFVKDVEYQSKSA